MKQLQELAEFLRNAAYADNQSHYIDWSLCVLHPRTNDGDVGFSGGLWNHNRVKQQKHALSLSFRYSPSKGIYSLRYWKDGCEIYNPNQGTISLDAFQALVVDLFGIEELYDPKEVS